MSITHLAMTHVANDTLNEYSSFSFLEIRYFIKKFLSVLVFAIYSVIPVADNFNIFVKI